MKSQWIRFLFCGGGVLLAPSLLPAQTDGLPLPTSIHNLYAPRSGWGMHGRHHHGHVIHQGISSETVVLSEDGMADDITPIPENENHAPAPVSEPEYYGSMGEELGLGDADCGMSCEACGTVCGKKCGHRWFASFAGMNLTRDDIDTRFLGDELNNAANHVLPVPDTDPNGGGEVHLGRWFGARSRVEASYWIVGSLTDSTEAFGALLPAGALQTNLDVATAPVALGANVLGDFFVNSAAQTLRRENDFQNLEINFIRGGVRPASGSFTASWMGGIRFFQFDENLLYGSVANGFAFGANGGANEAYIQSDVENNLVGFQFGGRGELFVGKKWSIYAAPKIGLYGNHINQQASVFRGDGVNGLLVNSQVDEFAVLGEIEAGINYEISPRWRVFGGYRVIAASGIALADDQIPLVVSDTAQWADVNSNGDLIIHGGFGGLEYRF